MQINKDMNCPAQLMAIDIVEVKVKPQYIFSTPFVVSVFGIGKRMRTDIIISKVLNVTLDEILIEDVYQYELLIAKSSIVPQHLLMLKNLIQTTKPTYADIDCI